MDEGMAIRQAVDTGDVQIGTRSAERSVKKKTAKMIVIATNCPGYPWLKNLAVKVHRFNGNGLDLGAACGKPYSISVIAIVNPGESSILSL